MEEPDVTDENTDDLERPAGLYAQLADAVYACLNAGDKPEALVRQVRANIDLWRSETKDGGEYWG